MNLRSQLQRDKLLLDRVLTATKVKEALGFGDVLWAPMNFAEFWERFNQGRDLGVWFTTASRIFVLEEHSGELRFYAGPWGAGADEANELGVFSSLDHALVYAVAFLIDERHPREINVLRGPPAHNNG